MFDISKRKKEQKHEKVNGLLYFQDYSALDFIKIQTKSLNH